MKQLYKWGYNEPKDSGWLRDTTANTNWQYYLVCTCGKMHTNAYINPPIDSIPSCGSVPTLYSREEFISWYNTKDVSSMEIVDSIGVKYDDYIINLLLKGHYNSIVVCSCPKQHTTANEAKNNYPYGDSFVCKTAPYRFTFKEWKAKFVDRPNNYNNMPKGVQLDNDDEATILAKKFLQDVKRIYKEPPKPPDTWIGAVVVLAMWLRSQRIPTDFGSNLELYEAPQKS